MSVGGRDVQRRHRATVHHPSAKGSGTSPAATEGLVIRIVGCSQCRATTGIGRGCGHDNVRAVPCRSQNLNIIGRWRGRGARGLRCEHGQGVGRCCRTPRIWHYQIRRGKVSGPIFHRTCPISSLIAGSAAANSGARRTEGCGKKVEASKGIPGLSPWGKGRSTTCSTGLVGRGNGRRLGVELIDPYRLGAIMAAEANTPVVNLTH